MTVRLSSPRRMSQKFSLDKKTTFFKKVQQQNLNAFFQLMNSRSFKREVNRLKNWFWRQSQRLIELGVSLSTSVSTTKNKSKESCQLT